MAQPLASASTSSSASSHGNYSYQIFINHRGDVKKTFASHLYRRLLRDGFRVFLDQSELERGEEIVSQIEGAIATASVHVAILSSGYAQSRWCLDELVLMLESKESRAATVIPVFYNVKPSDLRWTDKKRAYAEAFLNDEKEGIYSQERHAQFSDVKRAYVEAFLKHEKEGRYSQERLAGWRKSLFDVSHISGFELEACNGLPQSFGDLTNLQKVKLASCRKLKMLPDSMNLIRLKHLDLEGCSNLILTGQTLENVRTLERLDFSGCGKMGILPSQVTRQQFLKELILMDTNLKELPNGIGDLSNLEILNIGSPSLETLPHSLGKLTKLKNLSLLCSWKLKDLPESVGELKQLKKLSIYAPIREVTFASVEKVQGGRRLLDSCIDKCMPRLKQLHLYQTRITEISFGEGVCPVLEDLDLQYSHELVEVGGLPTTLTSLNLNGCRALKKLRGLRCLAKLRALKMYGCCAVEELPGLETLISLNEMWTSECDNMERIMELAEAAIPEKNPESQVLKKVFGLIKRF